MAYNPSRRRKPMSQINVVPYIDVMLVLLIIFMVTAPLLQQGVEVDLPKAPSEPLPEAQQKEPLVINVDQQGKFYLNQDERPMEEQSLAAAVRDELKQSPDKPVYVRGDQSVNYGRIVTAMVILQNAGAEGIGLITEPPPKSPK